MLRRRASMTGQIYEYDTRAQLQIFAELKQPVSIYTGILQHTNNISAALFCLCFLNQNYIDYQTFYNNIKCRMCIIQWICVYIMINSGTFCTDMLKSYQCNYSDFTWGVSDHWQINCLFHISSSQTIKKTQKFCIAGPLWGKSRCD